MITKRDDGVKELDIFRSFKKDFNLPKFKELKEGGQNTSSVVSSSGFVVVQSNGSSTASVQTFGTFISNDGAIVNTAHTDSSLSFFNKIKQKIKNIFAPKQLSIQETYKVIFKNLEELEKFNETSKKLQDELNKAKLLNQTALYEKLSDHLKIKMYENQLVSLKRLKYISEAKLIEFTEKSERGLRLDWVANFSRTIPDKVFNEKLLLDEYKIFDNYVVFHYDPENKSVELTKEEIAKKRDPILFGVIEDSKNLYYIGDWIDEYCDLTFDKLIKEFSKTELKLKAHKE